MELFTKNSWKLLDNNYFCKKLDLRCFSAFWLLFLSFASAKKTNRIKQYLLYLRRNFEIVKICFLSYFGSNTLKNSFSRKTNISYLLIRTRSCAYQGVKNVYCSENVTCFFFLETAVLCLLLWGKLRKTVEKRDRTTYEFKITCSRDVDVTHKILFSVRS